MVGEEEREKEMKIACAREGKYKKRLKRERSHLFLAALKQAFKQLGREELMFSCQFRRVLIENARILPCRLPR